MEEDKLQCVLCGSRNEIGKHTLHRLPPADDPERKRWIAFIRNRLDDKNWVPEDDVEVTVCARHFRPDDFEVGYCKNVLRSDILDRPTVVLVNKQVAPAASVTVSKYQTITSAAKKNDPAEDEIKITPGSVHHFQVTEDKSVMVHILVERESDVDVWSLHSADDVSNFIKSPYKKFLPGVIRNYETNIKRLTNQQQPISESDRQVLQRSEQELDVLQEKLFRWAVLALEENFSLDLPRLETDFDRAQYLIFKSTEHLQKNSGNDLRNLTFRLEQETQARREKDAQVDSLRALLQRTIAEKANLAFTLAKVKEQAEKEAQDLCRVVAELQSSGIESQKEIRNQDLMIKLLNEELEEKKETLRALNDEKQKTRPRKPKGKRRSLPSSKKVHLKADEVDFKQMKVLRRMIVIDKKSSV